MSQSLVYTSREVVMLGTLKQQLEQTQAGNQKISHTELKKRIGKLFTALNFSPEKKADALLASDFFGPLLNEALMRELSAPPPPVQPNQRQPNQPQQNQQNPQQQQPAQNAGGGQNPQQQQPQRQMHNVANLNLHCAHPACNVLVTQLPFQPTQLPGGGYRPVYCPQHVPNRNRGQNRNRQGNP